MKKKFINATHIEGLLYSHTLVLKETGPNSKNPGTPFISGEIVIATDNELTNTVPVHFTYVTETTASGSTNATFGVLSQIINETVKSITKHGESEATALRVDSAIGLNEFYSDRNGEEELVSVKRNEGGFVHIVTPRDSMNDASSRNTFNCDFLITKVREIEADEERGLPAKAIATGYVFDFRRAPLPIEFSILHPGAISHFMGLEATSTRPVFYPNIKGKQISSTVVRKIEEEGAWGVSIREVTSSRKDWVIDWAPKEPGEWDDESTITAAEMREALENRNVYLASVKKRQDEYNAGKNNASSAFADTKPASKNDDFKF